MVFRTIKYTLSCMLLLICSVSAAGDVSEYESRFISNFETSNGNGEIISLRQNTETFIALYLTSSTRVTKGIVILLHSIGGHPDWPQVISPLRVALPEQGWSTLSIQIPILGVGQPLSDYGKIVDRAGYRLWSAVQHSSKLGYRNIVIIGYSFGAALAVKQLATSKNDKIKALIGVSMQSQPFLNPRLELTKYLGKLNLPVLDIFGSKDFLEVVQNADERRLAARKQNSRYHQQVIPGADHHFMSQENILVSHILNWLERNINHVDNNINSKNKIKNPEFFIR